MAAIYQWFIDDVVYTVLTTTIYPAEATEGMDFDISLVSGYMMLIPEDEYVVGIESLDGSITTILLTSDPMDDEYIVGIESLDGSITAILLISDPMDDKYTAGIESLDGSIISKLVYAQMPDEGLDLSIALVGGSMTPV